MLGLRGAPNPPPVPFCRSGPVMPQHRNRPPPWARRGHGAWGGWAASPHGPACPTRGSLGAQPRGGGMMPWREGDKKKQTVEGARRLREPSRWDAGGGAPASPHTCGQGRGGPGGGSFSPVPRRRSPQHCGLWAGSVAGASRWLPSCGGADRSPRGWARGRAGGGGDGRDAPAAPCDAERGSGGSAALPRGAPRSGVGLPRRHPWGSGGCRRGCPPRRSLTLPAPSR